MCISESSPIRVSFVCMQRVRCDASHRVRCISFGRRCSITRKPIVSTDRCTADCGWSAAVYLDRTCCDHPKTVSCVGVGRFCVRLYYRVVLVATQSLVHDRYHGGVGRFPRDFTRLICRHYVSPTPNAITGSKLRVVHSGCTTSIASSITSITAFIHVLYVELPHAR